ncbi:MAG: SpvB/TcaC N-terminal domain-containing protein [Candidatus Omnitrophica bacterium]|nr:SpvB/TcaC N-terminal domain-containing protein [Candidatus Omnitrophota bacterium]
MKKPLIFKPISLVLIVAHLFVFCLRDAAYANEAPASAAPSPVTTEELMGYGSGENISSSGSQARPLSIDAPGAAPMPENLIKSFHLDPYSGSPVISFPIYAPAGRKGIQPNLALSYSASSGNDLLGVGWRMDMGCIERSTKKGVPKYDSTDTFICSLGGSASELVSVGANEYRSRIEGDFMKFAFDGTSWSARDKQGNTYYFGLDSVLSDRSREYEGTDVFRWRLSEIKDINGNYLFIKYLENGSFEVRYTGKPGTDRGGYGDASQGLSLRVEAEVETEEREDPIENYRSGFKIETRRRLKAVNVYSNTGLIRKYVFGYKYSKKTGRSLLRTVTEYGSDGTTAMPALTFTYQDNPEPIYSVSIITDDPTKGDNLWNCRFDGGFDYGHDNFGPVPGPAFEPVFGVKWVEGPYVKSSGSWSNGSWSIESNGNLHFSSSQDAANWFWTYVYVKQPKTLNVPLRGIDAVWLNGDYSRSVAGEPWHLKEGYNLIEITAYNQHESINCDLNYALADNVDLMNSTQVILPQLSCDFNADGLADAGTFIPSSGKVMVSLSNGTAFLPKEAWIEDFAKDGRLLLGDFNGDGRTDAAGISSTGGSMRLALSDGKKFVDAGVRLSGMDRDWQYGTGDFNADGLTDVCVFYKSGGKLYSKYAVYIGGGLEILPTEREAGGENDIPFTGDFNADGLADIGSFNYDSGNWQIALNTGQLDSQFRDLEVVSGFGAKKNFVVSDFNSDGLTDIGYYDYSTGRMFYKPSKGLCFGDIKEVNLYVIFSDPTSQIQSADYNGDGLTDFFAYGASGNLELALSQGEFPDLLRKVENGLGGSLDLEYGASSRFDNKGGDEQTDLPFTLPVLTASLVSDGQGSSYRTSYFYAGGLYDIPDKDFRGFGYVKTTDAEGNYTETYFEQGEILKGRAKEALTKDPSGNIYSRQLTQWRIKDVSSGGDVNEADAVAGRSYLPYAARQDTYIYDGAGSSLVNTASTTAIALENGLVSRAQVTELGDLSIGSDDRITLTIFDNSRRDRWIVGLPHEVNVISDDTTWNRKSVAYNSNGQPSSEAVTCHNPLTNSDTLYTSGYTYDNGLSSSDPLYADYGNLVKTTDPKGNVTTTIYDNTYRAFPVEVRNALGHTVKTEYYGVNESNGFGFGLFGQVKSTTDPNGQTTRNIYDKLGRLWKVVGPNDTEEYPAVSYEYRLDTSPVKVIKKVKYSSQPAGYYHSYSFFDGLGRLMQEKSPANESGKQVVSGRVVYDAAGRAKEKYRPYYVRSSAQLNRDVISDITKVVYDYDPAGRISRVTNPDGTYVSTAYNGLEVTVTDEAGRYKTTVSDSFGRVAQAREFNEGAQYTTRYVYDPLGNLTGIVDDQGNTTRITYDSLGRKLYMNDPDMGEWRYEYDAAGNLMNQTDAKGQVLRFDYDALNRLTRKYTDSTILAAYAYDDSSKQNCIGRLSRVTYPSGSTDFFYDNLGREVKSLKSIDGVSYTVERAYDPLDRLTSVIYPDSSRVWYAYGPQGAVHVTGNGSEAGNRNINPGQPPDVASLPDTYANPDSYTRLQLGFDGSQGDTFTFDDLGNPVAFSGNAYIDTQEQRFGSGSLLLDGKEGSYLSITDNEGWNFGSGDFTIDFWVKFNTMASSVTIAQQTDSDYKNLWYITLNPPAGNAGFSALSEGVYAGDFVGSGFNVTTDTWYHFAVVRDGSACRMFLNGAALNVTAYSPFGTMPDSNAPLKISVDMEGKHHLDGRLDEFRVSKGIARWNSNFTPPGQERIAEDTTSVSNIPQGTIVQNVIYHSTGQIKSITYGNGAVTDYAYDNMLRLSDISTESSAGTLQSLHYDFYNDGNISNITDNKNRSFDQSFTYDDLGRLTQAQGAYGVKSYDYDSIGNIIEKDGLTFTYDSRNKPHAVRALSDGTEFEYDANGNMTVKAGQNFIYDIENRLTCIERGAFDDGIDTYELHQGWNLIFFPRLPEDSRIDQIFAPIKGEFDQISRYNTSTQSYEHYVGIAKFNDFEALEVNRNYYVYVTSSNGAALTVTSQPVSTLETLASYAYDGDGGRVKKTAGDIATKYVGSLYEITTGSGNGDNSIVRAISAALLTKRTKHIFLGSNRICTITSSPLQDNIEGTNEVISYFHSDHLGSSSVITNNSGAIVQEAHYAPYGEFVSGSPTPDDRSVAANRYYNGKELDQSGLYYYGARYYDPTIGRFTQADTIVQDSYNPQTLNRYSYCNNNPINLVDPTGHGWFKKHFGKFFGIIAGILGTLLTGNMMFGFQLFNLFNSFGNAVNTGNWGGFAGGLAGGILGGMAGVGWATGIAKGLGESTYTFGGGFLIGAAEMGTAGFGGAFGETLGSGGSFGDAMKAGGIGFGIGAITGGLIEGSYLGGYQTFAHGLSVDHFVSQGVLPPIVSPPVGAGAGAIPQAGLAAEATASTARSTKRYGWGRYLHGTDKVSAALIRKSPWGLNPDSYVTLHNAIDPATGKMAMRLNPAEFRRFVSQPRAGVGEWFVDVLAPNNAVFRLPNTGGGAPQFQIHGENRVIDAYPNPN